MHDANFTFALPAPQEKGAARFLLFLFNLS